MICINIFALVVAFLATGILTEDLNDTTAPTEEAVTVVNRDGRIVENEQSLQNSIDAGENSIQPEKQHELDLWEAPYFIQKNFIYYHAGFDDDGRPIWMWELGKWNFRLVTEKGEETLKNFNKYMDQLVHRIIKSLGERSTPEEPVTNVIVLIDMDLFSLVQMAHVPTVSLILGTLAKFRPIIDEYLYVGMAINTNAAAHGLIRLVRPVLGQIMERIEIHGTNKARWIPQVLKHCPKKSLPSWYGGLNDFKPLKVYG